LTCGVIIAMVAVWAALQTRIRLDLGIARLLFRPTSRLATLQSGHMGPCAAGCFFLTGSALLLLGFPSRTRARTLVLQGTLAALVVLNMLAFFGQFTGFMRFWDHDQATRMAPHEILGFCAGSVSLLFLSFRGQGLRAGLERGLSFGVGLGFLSATAVL